MADRIDIFISYKREERDLAEAFSRALQGAGYTVVTDLNIQKAVDFGAAIDGMIRAARMVLVLWTPAAAASRWVCTEAVEGHHQDKYFGVMVRPVPAEDLPLDVRRIQYHDVSGAPLDAALASTVAEVAALLGPAEMAADEAGTRSAAATGDLEFFQVVHQVGEPSGYAAYIAAYPDGIYAATARARVAAARHWTARVRRWAPSAALLGALAAVATAVPLYLAPRGGDPDQIARLTAERDAARSDLARVRAASQETVLANQLRVAQERMRTAEDLATARARETTRLTREIDTLNQTVARLIEEAAEARQRSIAPEALETRIEALALTVRPASRAELTEAGRSTRDAGLFVVAVEPESEASGKGMEPGQIVLEMSQRRLETVETAREAVRKALADGRSSVLLLVVRPDGELRFVALGLGETGSGN